MGSQLIREQYLMDVPNDGPLSDIDESAMAKQHNGGDELMSTSWAIVRHTPGGSSFWVPDVKDKPIIGTLYATHEDAYLSYKAYGDKCGFEVRKGTSRSNRGVVVSKYMVCNKEGVNPKPRLKDDINVGTSKRNRRRRITGRTNCHAHIRVRINGVGQYLLDEFEETHNHVLVSQEDMSLVKSRRKLNYTQQSMMHRMSNYNLGPNKSHQILSEIAGGSDRLGASVVDFKNFKRDILQFIGDADAQMAVEKMLYKKESDDDFSFDVLCGEDKVLSAMFWADDVAKRNYFAFGDVVSFDATFRTNKYKMVFVPFTGIDNHRKCVTFGAGLLSRETIESYEWLLRAFLSAFRTEPKIVVTDQDPAMRQAIINVFPSAIHRLCLWHVMDKLTVKVGPKICATTNFRKRFNDLVWSDELDPEGFEAAWVDLISEFNLTQNKWLADMYSIRDRFIPAFFRDVELSGLMRTTSRSESENKFFQKVLHANLTLVEFISHFEMAMYFQRAKQRINDHDSRYKRIETKTTLAFEKHASDIYTLTMFGRVQVEIIESNESCMCTSSSCEGAVKKCFIRDSDISDDARSIFQVVFDIETMQMKCSCTLFDSQGFLCRHCFCVLRLYRYQKIPAPHIVSRWTKNAIPHVGYSAKRHLIPGVKEPTEALIRELLYRFDQVINRFVGDMDMLAMFADQFKEFLGKFDDVVTKELSKKDLISNLLGVSQPEEVNIHVPIGIRNKGCGTRKRLVGSHEEARGKTSKPKRKCRRCKLMCDHDSRNCPTKETLDNNASS